MGAGPYGAKYMWIKQCVLQNNISLTTWMLQRLLEEVDAEVSVFERADAHTGDRATAVNPALASRAHDRRGVHSLFTWDGDNGRNVQRDAGRARGRCPTLARQHDADAVAGGEQPARTTWTCSTHATTTRQRRRTRAGRSPSTRACTSRASRASLRGRIGRGSGCKFYRRVGTSKIGVPISRRNPPNMERKMWQKCQTGTEWERRVRKLPPFPSATPLHNTPWRTEGQLPHAAFPLRSRLTLLPHFPFHIRWISSTNRDT